jgi:hypothetical protein
VEFGCKVRPGQERLGTGNGRPNAWFVGMAPAAILTLPWLSSESTGAGGADAAAPIAARVIEAYVHKLIAATPAEPRAPLNSARIHPGAAIRRGHFAAPVE